MAMLQKHDCHDDVMGDGRRTVYQQCCQWLDGCCQGLDAAKGFLVAANGLMVQDHSLALGARPGNWRSCEYNKHLHCSVQPQQHLRAVAHAWCRQLMTTVNIVLTGWPHR